MCLALPLCTYAYHAMCMCVLHMSPCTYHDCVCVPSVYPVAMYVKGAPKTPHFIIRHTSFYAYILYAFIWFFELRFGNTNMRINSDYIQFDTESVARFRLCACCCCCCCCLFLFICLTWMPSHSLIYGVCFAQFFTLFFSLLWIQALNKMDLPNICHTVFKLDFVLQQSTKLLKKFISWSF